MGAKRESLLLTAEQILYLVALTGGKGIPGIELQLDSGADAEAGLRSLFAAQQRLLEAKGLIDVGFDGVVTIDESLHGFITHCAGERTYYCQFIESVANGLQRVYYWAHDAGGYEMSIHADQGVYEVRPLYDRMEMQLQVIQRFPLIDADLHQDKHFDEVDYTLWMSQARQSGNIITSIVQFEWRSDEWAATKELSLLIGNAEMWHIKTNDESSYKLISLSCDTAMNEICLWLKHV